MSADYWIYKSCRSAAVFNSISQTASAAGVMKKFYFVIANLGSSVTSTNEYQIFHGEKD